MTINDMSPANPYGLGAAAVIDGHRRKAFAR